MFEIDTPSQNEALAFKSDFGLEKHGILNLRIAYWNLPTEALYEEIIFRKEAHLSNHGALIAFTGKHTARAASDKVIIKEPSTENHIWWQEYNRPYSEDKFDDLYNRLQGFLQGRDIFVQDCYVGADHAHRIPIRIISEYAWHSLFARNMFILPESVNEYRHHVPEFTVISIPSFKAIPSIDGTPSETIIALNFARRMCIIGNTIYAGEIKKSVFTLLNYVYPLQGIMTMHCSANIGKNNDTAIFFGLSGTGKTTLSADPERRLIGDDEHGWNDKGVFNFEGGCYAKVIRLSAEAEPQIFATTHRYGTILENVVYDPYTRQIDLDDESITENTRASYPLKYILNSVPEKMGDHPQNIILLTCDASGVMPPISRLTSDQALYQFISGYTSKIAGTEIGTGKEPKMTFSTCFGAPFIVHHPYFYAKLLKEKIEKNKSNCWLVNTGWIGGAFGVGKRISIQYTRKLLNAALNGQLLNVPYTKDTVFGFEVPQKCSGVPDKILNPSDSWPDKALYEQRYKQLASKFIDNFKKYADGCPPEVAQAGPKI